jgi:hypothetical protein
MKGVNIGGLMLYHLSEVTERIKILKPNLRGRLLFTAYKEFFIDDS